METNLTAALIPLEITWGDKRTNLDRAAKAIASLPEGTDLAVLPETFSTGFPVGMSREKVAALAESADGPTMRFIRELAASRNLAIAGSFIAREGESLRNRAFFAEPSGDVTFADKRHLFTMAGEHEIFDPGQDRLLVRFRGWNIAMAVCYDMRFPVWLRNQNNAYDALLVVANWPQVRVSAWDALIPARAIENEAYVCAVDCRGTDPKDFVYNGSSQACDFKGKNVGRSGEDGIIMATLDMEALTRFRTKFPAWQDADAFRLL